MNFRLLSFRSARAKRSTRLVARTLLAALLLATRPASGEPAPQSSNSAPPADTAPMHIAAPGGEVILPDARAKQSYDHGWAAVRRSGDLLFLSGVIVYRRPEEGTDVPSFKDQVRRTFTRIGQSLAAAGASFDDVVLINSFHVWSGPDFSGSREDQFKAFEEVKEEFMHGPRPAWTAVGASGLLGQGGIVEVQIIANSPAHRGS